MIHCLLADSSLLHDGSLFNVLVAASAIGVTCAVLSLFVVLLKWSFFGEGISHSMIAGWGTASVAALVFPKLDSPIAAFVIAILFCLASALGIGWISRRKPVGGDAAIGVFVVASLAWGTCAFAIRQHVKHGLGAEGGLDAYLFGSDDHVTAASTLAAVGMCLFVLIVVSLLRKPFFAFCLDPVLAEVGGVPVAVIHYVLLLLLALVVITGVKLLGVLLAPAVLILPGALALSLSVRLRRVLLLSIGATLLAVLAAALLTSHFRYIPIGAAIVLALFVEFIIAAIIR